MMGKKQAYFYLILTNCLWGATAVVGKIGLTYLTVTNLFCIILIMSGIRFSVSGMAQCLEVHRSIKREEASLKDAFLVAFLSITLYIPLSYLASYYLSSSMNVVLTQLAIFTTILAGVLFQKEKLTKVKLITASLGVFACLLTTMPLNTTGTTPIGIICIVLASLLYGGNSAYLKTCMKRNNPTFFGGLYCTIGGILCFLLVLVLDSSAFVLFCQLPIPIYVCIAIQTLVSYVSNKLYWKALPHLEVGQTVLFGLIEILVGLVLSLVLFKDTVTVCLVLGVILLIVAITYFAKSLKNNQN